MKYLNIFQLKNFSKERAVEFVREIYKETKKQGFLNQLKKIYVKQGQNDIVLKVEITQEDMLRLVEADRYSKRDFISQNEVNELLSNIGFIQTHYVCLLCGLYLLNGTDKREAHFKLNGEEDIVWKDIDNKTHSYTYLGDYEKKIKLMDLFIDNENDDIVDLNDYNFVIDALAGGLNLKDIVASIIDKEPLPTPKIDEIFISNDKEIKF